MSDIPAKPAEHEVEKGNWGEIFRGELGLYSALVIGGIAMHATQMLVIAIIMPSIAAESGGASYSTWAAMLYTIGSIVGGASTGVVWARLGARRGYAMAAGIFALGTVACALAPDIGTLIAARTVQGWAGGLVAGSGMALITSLYSARLRTRIIAIRAVLTGSMDTGAAWHDADLGQPVPAAVAASRTRRLAGVRQFSQHHHLVRMDPRHLHRLGLVGGPRTPGIGIGSGARIRRPGVPDTRRRAALIGLIGGEHPADGARHRHLQCASRGPHDGERRNRRAAQPRFGADVGALARHRLWRGDCRSRRQHRRSRRGDRPAGRGTCSDDGL